MVYKGTMNTAIKDSAARDKILSKACELFYNQGYQATGINQIIEESGVAKATFYSHFPSKDELCLAYVKHTAEQESSHLKDEVARRRTPLSKYMAAIEILEPWLIETNFRGCPFLNMVPEVREHGSPIRQVGASFYSAHQTVIEQTVRELIDSNPKKYSELNAKNVAKEYMMIFAGAVALCEIFHSIEPLRLGINMVKELVA